MRKKHLLTKALTLVLSAAICAGGTGLETLAASVEITQTQEVQPDGAQEQADTVSANDAATEENGDTVTDPEEPQEEVTQGELADPEETDDENETTGEEETEAGEEDLDADEAKQLPVDSELFANVSEDTNLTKAVIALYNEATDSSVTEGTFTIGMLKEYTGIFDFTSASASKYAQNITDITGLGCARKVTAIDISTTQITVIPSFEFNGCTQLTEIKLPSTVNKVSDRAFASCSGLAEINLPDTVTEIGAYAFSSCSKLAGINAVKDGTDSILDTLPSSLTQIGTNAFDGCSALRKIVVPSYDGAILQNATSLFANCSSLEEVEIGSSIMHIPSSGFKNSGAAAGMVVTIEEGSKLSKILQSAFEGASMSSIDLSNCTRLTTIEADAFAKGNSKNPLTEIKMPADIKEGETQLQLDIGKEAFYQAPLANMYAGDTADKICWCSSICRKYCNAGTGTCC